MRLLAPAKINLWLTVGGRRADGYHDVVSVMQAVSLADELAVEAADATTLDVDPPGSAPEDESNLVVAAIRAMRAATGAAGGAAVRLTKRIPVAAGLAGGSADAAATLVGLNELWGAGISKKALEKMGERLGADVPFCVRGGTATARGTGGDLSPLPCPVPMWWVIASFGGSKPSTKEVYERFDALGGPGLDDPYEAADALARGDAEALARRLRNDLLPAAAALDPGVGGGAGALAEAGALGAVLTGAGPAWCGLARDESHAREVRERLAGATWSFVARSVDHGAKIAGR